jgi:hypothetical protein
MQSLRRNPRCYWPAVGCDSRATCSWSRLTALLLGDCWECCLLFTEAHLVRRAVQWSLMKPESELIRLVATNVFADLPLSLVTLRLTERATRTALLELDALTSPCHLANWIELRRLVNCLEADPSVNTARNNTWIVVIVGYHGNPVYRAVAWILIFFLISNRNLRISRF